MLKAQKLHHLKTIQGTAEMLSNAHTHCGSSNVDVSDEEKETAVLLQELCRLADAVEISIRSEPDPDPQTDD